MTVKPCVRCSAAAIWARVSTAVSCYKLLLLSCRHWAFATKMLLLSRRPSFLLKQRNEPKLGVAVSTWNGVAPPSPRTAAHRCHRSPSRRQPPVPPPLFLSFSRSLSTCRISKVTSKMRGFGKEEERYLLAGRRHGVGSWGEADAKGLGEGVACVWCSSRVCWGRMAVSLEDGFCRFGFWW